MSNATPRQKSAVPSLNTPRTRDGLFKQSDLSRITKNLLVKAIAGKDEVEVWMFARVTIPPIAPGATKQFPLFHEPSSVDFDIIHSHYHPLPSSGALHAPEAGPEIVLAAKELGIQVLKYRRGGSAPEDERLKAKIKIRNYEVCLVVGNFGQVGTGRNVKSPEPVSGRNSPALSTRSTGGEEKEGTDYLLAFEMRIGYICLGGSNLPTYLSIPTPYCLRNTLKFVLPSSSSSLMDVILPSRRITPKDDAFKVKVFPALREKSTNTNKTINRRKSMNFEGIVPDSDDEGTAAMDEEGDVFEGNFSSTDKVEIRWTDSKSDGVMKWEAVESELEFKVGKYTDCLLDPDRTEDGDQTVSSIGRVPVQFSLQSRLSGLSFPSCEDTGVVELEVDSFLNGLSSGIGELITIEDIKLDSPAILGWDIIDPRLNSRVATSRGELNRRPSSIFSDIGSTQPPPGTERMNNLAPTASQSRPSSIVSVGSASGISLLNTRAPFSRDNEFEMSFENSISSEAEMTRQSPLSSSGEDGNGGRSNLILRLTIDVLRILKELAENTFQLRSNPKMDPSAVTPNCRFTLEGTLFLAFTPGVIASTPDSEADSWIDVQDSNEAVKFLPIPVFRYVGVPSQSNIVTVIPSVSSRGSKGIKADRRIKIPPEFPVFPLDPTLRLPANAVRTKIDVQVTNRGYVTPLNGRILVSVPTAMATPVSTKTHTPISPPSTWDTAEEPLTSPLSRHKPSHLIRDSRDNLMSSIASTSTTQSPNLNLSVISQPSPVDITEICLSSVKVLLAPTVGGEKVKISHGHITTFLPYFSAGENEDRRIFVIQFEIKPSQRFTMNPGSCSLDGQVVKFTTVANEKPEGQVYQVLMDVGSVDDWKHGTNSSGRLQFVYDVETDTEEIEMPLPRFPCSVAFMEVEVVAEEGGSELDATSSTRTFKTRNNADCILFRYFSQPAFAPSTIISLRTTPLTDSRSLSQTNGKAEKSTSESPSGMSMLKWQMLISFVLFLLWIFLLIGREIHGFHDRLDLFNQSLLHAQAEMASTRVTSTPSPSPIISISTPITTFDMPEPSSEISPEYTHSLARPQEPLISFIPSPIVITRKSLLFVRDILDVRRLWRKIFG